MAIIRIDKKGMPVIEENDLDKQISQLEKEVLKERRNVSFERDCNHAIKNAFTQFKNSHWDRSQMAIRTASPSAAITDCLGVPAVFPSEGGFRSYNATMGKLNES